MPVNLRFESRSWATHNVVSRCIQGFGFLKPTREIRAITRGVLAYSLEQHQETIELHHYVVLSNHFHLLLSSKSSPDLDQRISKLNCAKMSDPWRVRLEIRDLMLGNSHVFTPQHPSYIIRETYAPTSDILNIALLKLN